jgi:hypothetical protein
MNSIHGVIESIDYFGTAAYLGIEGLDGGRYRVTESRIVNAPCGHRCLARVGDEVTFTLNEENKIAEVRFVKWPECRIEDDEISIVNNITEAGMIFGKRIKPNCRCPIFIGMQHHHPDIQPGMVVYHQIGRHNNKAIATNVSVNWSDPYTVPADVIDVVEGEGNETYASAGA